MHNSERSKQTFQVAAGTFGRRINRDVIKREARNQCIHRATLRSQEFSGTAQITNMSRSGMAVRLGQNVPSMVGVSISVKGSEIGEIKGVVRWQKGSMLGVQFDSSTSSKSKLLAYFSFFGKGSAKKS